MNIFIRIGNLIRNLVHFNRIKADMENRLNFLEEREVILTEERKVLTEELKVLKEELSDGEYLVNRICSDSTVMSLLRTRLSGVPAVWGDKSRLHISEKAAVHTALFNVNSGEIFIGDYSFAGSNVSFLTGSHDMTLTGLLRRDCEIKEGNDIKIGKGVWIASDAAILGPCEIRDNAVIAAGAVVAPGTIVNDYEVYGGVPAKKIMSINKTTMSIQNESVKRALKREDGVVFSDGWSDKMIVEHDGEIYTGHMLLEDTAVIYTDKEDLQLFFEVKDDDPMTVIVIDGREYRIGQKTGILNIPSSGAVSVERMGDKKIFFGR